IMRKSPCLTAKSGPAAFDESQKYTQKSKIFGGIFLPFIKTVIGQIVERFVPRVNMILDEGCISPARIDIGKLYATPRILLWSGIAISHLPGMAIFQSGYGKKPKGSGHSKRISAPSMSFSESFSIQNQNVPCLCSCCIGIITYPTISLDITAP